MNRLQEIFDRQASLMHKYEEIEEQNGLLQTPDIPVDLNDRFGQARIRDFAWRMTEELGEALEALHDGRLADHHEELADALHFLAELTILTGYKPEELGGFSDLGEEDDILILLYEQAFRNIRKTNDSFRVAKWIEPGALNRNSLGMRYATGQVIENLALMINTLKNKAWKQSHRETDIARFKHYLDQTWISFCGLCLRAEIDDRLLYDLYFGKAQVNKTRQETGY